MRHDPIVSLSSKRSLPRKVAFLFLQLARIAPAGGAAKKLGLVIAGAALGMRCKATTADLLSSSSNSSITIPAFKSITKKVFLSLPITIKIVSLAAKSANRREGVKVAGCAPKVELLLWILVRCWPWKTQAMLPPWRSYRARPKPLAVGADSGERKGFHDCIDAAGCCAR